MSEEEEDSQVPKIKTIVLTLLPVTNLAPVNFAAAKTIDTFKKEDLEVESIEKLRGCKQKRSRRVHRDDCSPLSFFS